MTVRSSIALSLTLALSATTAMADGHASVPTPSAQAVLMNMQGEQVGTATLTQGTGGVLIHVKVSDLSPGKKGLHLHSHAACDAATGFKSAKGHVGKTEGGHGLLNADGPEAGDLPNIFVGADGTAQMEAYSTSVSITDGAENLLDADGSTFIIHEAADDHFSQPIGGAGGRVACGLIKPM